MSKGKHKIRSRMQPAERIENILDHVAILVVEEGVTAVTMDRVRQSANVSRSLIYNYFKDTNELLISLLERERRRFRLKQKQATDTAKTFEEMVRLTIRTSLQNYLDNGELNLRLTNEPAIANAIKQSDEELKWDTLSNQYFTEQIVNRYQLPEDIAFATFQIIEGLAESAGAKVISRLGEEGMALAEELVYTSNLASLRAISRKYSAVNSFLTTDDGEQK